MADIETPQFDTPFRLDSTGRDAVVVEQDSLDDVTNSVETLMRTPLGFLEEQPDYGMPEGIFSERGVDVAEVSSAITHWEERADVLIEEQPDLNDHFIQNIAIQVGASSDGV